MTPEEYFAWAEEQEVKYEYHHGDVFAMAGGTDRHALLTANTVIALGSALRGSGCRVYSSDLRVQLAESTRYVYPDLSVVCGESEFLDEGRTTLLNPTLVVEVLSPTSEPFDRGEKLQGYRRLSSVREIVLVAQDRKSIEVIRRTEAGWVLIDPDEEERIALTSVGTELRMTEVYEGVDVPDAGRPPGEPVMVG